MANKVPEVNILARQVEDFIYEKVGQTYYCATLLRDVCENITERIDVIPLITNNQIEELLKETDK